MFPYAFDFRFPPAVEGFAPDCTLRVGALTVEADRGRPDIGVSLVGLGVVIDDRGRLEHFDLPSGPGFDVARRGRPIASVADSTDAFALTYDRLGRLKKLSSSSETIVLTYDSAGRLTKLDFGAGSTESFAYDSSGHVVSYSDSGGDTGSFTYSAGHLTSSTITLTPMDPSYSFTYTSGGVLSSWSQSDAAPPESDLTVNSAGDVTRVTRATATDAKLTYVRRHVLREVTGNGGGVLASFTYDASDRLSTASSDGTNPTSFFYNSSGQLSSATYFTSPSTTETSTLTYDRLGRLVEVAGSGGEQTTLVYVPAPAATTHAASNTAKTTATLNGSVNPHGLPTGYRFQFGRTRQYGSVTQFHAAGNGNLPVAVADSLGHLAPQTTYHYRLIATSAAGTAVGTDQSLHTK